MVYFFFFQAEDGIRDYDVTGVQTCALPICQLPYVSFIEPVDPPSLPENKTGRTLHRSNVINAEYPTGRHYNGEGINIMMQDDGVIGPHIDYTGRVDQSNVDRKSTRLNSSHVVISYSVFCLKKKND